MEKSEGDKILASEVAGKTTCVNCGKSIVKTSNPLCKACEKKLLSTTRCSVCNKLIKTKKYTIVGTDTFICENCSP